MLAYSAPCSHTHTHQENHCRTHQATQKRMYVFQKGSVAHQATQKRMYVFFFFKKATVAPFRATESHGRATQRHSEPLRVTQSPCEPLRTRDGSGTCIFAVALLAHRSRSRRVTPRRKKQQHPSRLAQKLLHTHHASQNSRTHPSRHGHCPVDTARSCGAVVLVVLRCYGHRHQQKLLQQV